MSDRSVYLLTSNMWLMVAVLDGKDSNSPVIMSVLWLVGYVLVGLKK